jgi:uracil DNA glycosylase
MVGKYYNCNPNLNWEIILRVFKLPKDKVKVVIFNSDNCLSRSPNRLAFSNPKQILLSLKNIFKELQREYPNSKISESGRFKSQGDFETGNLSHWEEQGIFIYYNLER